MEREQTTSKKSNNAKQGKDCADTIYPDDGRISDGRKGDWGKHNVSDMGDRFVIFRAAVESGNIDLANEIMKEYLEGLTNDTTSDADGDVADIRPDDL